jgi:polyisoprenoid-binding protein YceI
MSSWSFARVGRLLRSVAVVPVRLVLLVAGIQLVCVFPSAADKWIVDKTSSAVHFSYDHFGLARKTGRFMDLDGRLDFSPTDPERGTVEITIKTKALSTGVAELDRLLLSSDFFDEPRFPSIVFKSTSVRQTGPKTGDIEGELTMLGVTKPVTLNATWNFTGEHPLAAINAAYAGKWVAGFSAKTMISRSQWGMSRGIPLLSDAVEIGIEVEFLRAD